MRSALLQWKAIGAQEAGQGMVEYAFLVLLLALPAVVAIGFFGQRVQELYAMILAAFP